MAILLYTVWFSPEAIHGWLSFFIPFALARGYPRLAMLLLYRLSPPEAIHGWLCFYIPFAWQGLELSPLGSII